jgi:allantoinase
VLHLSAASAGALVATAKNDGVPITAETCPHYLTLAAEDVPDGATDHKCAPPIRDRANQDRLWALLADGTIDAVVSDHSPCPPEDKRLDVGDVTTAWGGISSLQLGLPLVWSEARARGFGLRDVVGWMAGAPARIAGLSAKGAIEVGAVAGVVVWPLFILGSPLFTLLILVVETRAGTAALAKRGAATRVVPRSRYDRSR